MATTLEQDIEEFIDVIGDTIDAKNPFAQVLKREHALNHYIGREMKKRSTWGTSGIKDYMEYIDKLIDEAADGYRSLFHLIGAYEDILKALDE